jgi:ell wall binding domain 2 (CWB2)
MGRTLATLVATMLLALLVVACGKGGGPAGGAGGSGTGVSGDQPSAAADLGFPTFATKNTTRVAGADAIADAAGVALAVFPSTGSTTRPPAVVLADSGDWHGAIAAAALVARPVRAPLLLSHGSDMPAATKAALDRLAPAGSGVLGGAQVIRVGDVAAPAGLRSTQVPAGDPFTVAATIDRVVSSARGEPSSDVVVVGVDDPADAMPAAAWAAKSGDPVLFVERDRVPPATAAALRRHDSPRIFVVGPDSAVSDATLDALKQIGSSVHRIADTTPQRTSVDFARYRAGSFGWGIVDPGHGLVFANPTQPLAAAAAAPLSSSGTYGPLLLVDDDGSLPDPTVQFLLDIQPGFQDDPVRGVYNHAWLVGDEQAISADAQSRIDALLEISPVNDQTP